MNDVMGYRMNGGYWFVDKVWIVPGKRDWGHHRVSQKNKNVKIPSPLSTLYLQVFSITYFNHRRVLI